MEIERKFLVKQLPEQLSTYPHHNISQAYLCTEPVVRIRQLDDSYILTYKSKGLRSRIEEEMPLTKDAFHHLSEKADGNVIVKTRYLIPDHRNAKNYTIELDCFHDLFEGLYLAEVEFESEKDADSYVPPEWFSQEVTYDGNYHNSRLSEMSKENIQKLLSKEHFSL